MTASTATTAYLELHQDNRVTERPYPGLGGAPFPVVPSP